MSEQQSERKREIARRVALDTAPGKSNEELVKSAEELPETLREVRAELGNWVEFIDVRTYRDKRIGIPCRYRWTIKRWVQQDMDQWLLDHGWQQIAHLKAYSREHQPNEMEARYRKEINGYTVHVNIYVTFTEDVFEMLETGEPIRAAKEKKERKDAVRKLRERVRQQ